MPKIILLLITLSITSFMINANEVIKKSKNSICHDITSPSYSRIKHFTAYSSVQECLNEQGRLPKNTKSAVLIPDKYSRSKFGSGWKDNDKDCQNSRMEALILQSVAPVKFKTSANCKVVSGRWNSVYSGKTIYKASDIDIDHVVPLKWAWDHGANKWSKKKRVEIANDPINLLSVGASLNRQKGAKGLDDWLPPQNICQYILRFERIRKIYNLTLSSSEIKDYSAIKIKYCSAL